MVMGDGSGSREPTNHRKVPDTRNGFSPWGGVSLRERVRCSAIWVRLGIAAVLLSIEWNRFWWFRHMVRMPSGNRSKASGKVLGQVERLYLCYALGEPVRVHWGNGSLGLFAWANAPCDPISEDWWMNLLESLFSTDTCSSWNQSVQCAWPFTIR